MSGNRKIVFNYALVLYPNEDYCLKFEAEVFKLSKNNYKKYAYEKLGELEYIVKNTIKKEELSKKLNKFLEYLDDREIYGDFLKDVWSSETFIVFKNKKTYAISQQLLDETKLEKCEFPCRNKKCKSDKCYFYTEQTRSADEGSTVFIICIKCNSRYKFS